MTVPSIPILIILHIPVAIIFFHPFLVALLLAKHYKKFPFNSLPPAAKQEPPVPPSSTGEKNKSKTKKISRKRKKAKCKH